MNTLTQSTNQTEQGTKAPTRAQVKASIAEELNQLNATNAKLAQENASLAARVVKLEANQKPATEKKPVTDADLAKAIATLQAKNAADLKSPSPKCDLSLSGQLGFVPIFSAEQKTQWAKARDAMRAAHTKAWKEKSAFVIGHLRRAVRNPQAVMGGGIVTRKTDGAVNAVSLRASKLAKPTKPKGKGKNAAKPTQVAAKVPTPGNANPPAKV